VTSQPWPYPASFTVSLSQASRRQISRTTLPNISLSIDFPRFPDATA
jgi:hypothetical protein